MRGCTVYFVAKLSGAAITPWLISSACVMLCDEQRRSTFAQNVPGVCACVGVETLGLAVQGVPGVFVFVSLWLCECVCMLYFHVASLCLLSTRQVEVCVF